MSSNTLSIATSGSGNSPKSPMPRSLESISSRYWDRQAQRRSLPAVLAEKLENREELTKAEKNEVAAALHAWALERGAANFAHWFSPKRGSNASKYDAFIDLNYGTGDIQVEFSGSKLFQSETDGSSFPNGGLRVTHSAAAYVGWDMTSYPFVREGTLFIPSVLVTYNGEPLDDKTPLLRAQEAVSRSATRLLNLMGDNETTRVISNVGWEQEFFVVSRKVYLKRPDLIAAGRALFGKVPAKNQAREENYFSMPNLMVKKLFSTSAGELRKLGVSMNVAHAEVAPGQFEVSPIFTLTSRAADQNVLAREVMDETAHRLGLVVLWHEKPFAGINGSGKHANWGLNTNTGTNLFVPGKTQQSQERFTAFVAALSAAVFRHGDLLRIGTATAGNDHRLGAQEAPPAIISLYTGKTMGAHLEKVANEGGELHGYDRSSGGDSAIDLGTSDVQTLHRSLEDRNRTTPFPFCGNRFEFRAVGSAQNIAWPLTLLNTAMADALDSISDLIEGGKSVRDAVAETLRETLPAVFNGNNYADEWVVEAEKRGLWHLRNTAEALPQLTSEKNVALFAKHGIATEAVVHAWQHIHAEQYVETLHLEARSMLEILHTGIIPAVMQDAGRLASSVTNVQSQALQSYVGKRTALAEDIVAKTEALDAALSASEADEGDLLAQAKNIVANLIPAMNAARVAADQAENVVDRSAWPLPTISEVVYSNHVETD